VRATNTRTFPRVCTYFDKNIIPITQMSRKTTGIRHVGYSEPDTAILRDADREGAMKGQKVCDKRLRFE
jgi:hypothetical protein